MGVGTDAIGLAARNRPIGNQIFQFPMSLLPILRHLLLFLITARGNVEAKGTLNV